MVETRIRFFIDSINTFSYVRMKVLPNNYKDYIVVSANEGGYTSSFEIIFRGEFEGFSVELITQLDGRKRIREYILATKPMLLGKRIGLWLSERPDETLECIPRDYDKITPKVLMDTKYLTKIKN